MEPNKLLRPDDNENDWSILRIEDLRSDWIDWITLNIEKLYEFRNNICLTDGINNKFWELVVKVVHANYSLVKYDMKAEVFQKIKDCAGRNFVKWAEKQSSGVLSKELISKIMSGTLI